jgi:hypothetical protein
MIGQELEGLDAVPGQAYGTGVGDDECPERLALNPQGQHRDRSGPGRAERLGADEAPTRRITGGATRADTFDEGGE